jgi:uncharacterized protein (TIGR03435 family)
MHRLLAVALVLAFAGRPSAQAPKPSFEEATVAGIPPSIPNHDRRQLTTTMLIDRTDLLQLIVSAYLDADGVGACAIKISSGDECAPIVGSVPAWMRTSKFEVAAKLPAASLPVEVIDRLRDFRFTGSPRRNVYPLPIQLMLQRLLEQTFDLDVRRERRQIPVYAITRTKDVSLMHSSVTATAGTNGAVMATRRPSPPRTPDDAWVLVFEGSTLTDAADFFSGFLDRPVIDRTGVEGPYNFTFEFKPVPGAPWRKGPWGPVMAGFDAARLAAGLDALGFALESTTAAFDVLVIEQMSRPSSN